MRYYIIFQTKYQKHNCFKKDIVTCNLYSQFYNL